MSRVDLATDRVTHIDVGARPADVRVGFGSVWVLTDVPTTALIRLDPTTNAIVGRLALPLRPTWPIHSQSGSTRSGFG